MRTDAISAYSSQSYDYGSQQSQEFTNRVLNAAVTTRTVGLNIGKFGVSYTTRNISFTPDRTSSPTFEQELELSTLSANYVGPFRPAASYSQNATIQRIGLSAYASQAAQSRSMTPMLDIVV